MRRSSTNCISTVECAVFLPLFCFAVFLTFARINYERYMERTEILNQFEDFVERKLTKQRVRYATKNELSPDEYFAEYWHPFFIELVTQSLILYHRYKTDVENPNEFAERLQDIAEDGLVKLRKQVCKRAIL